MNTNYTRSDTALLAAEKIALSIVGGIVLWLIPSLQIWLVYLIWGPILGGVFVWLYWEIQDVSAEKTNWQATPIRAFIIGLAHIIAVTIVWMLVTRWLQ